MVNWAASMVSAVSTWPIWQRNCSSVPMCSLLITPPHSGQARPVGRLSVYSSVIGLPSSPLSKGGFAVDVTGDVGQKLRHVAQRHAIVGTGMPQCTRRHLDTGSVRRVLHHSDAARGSYGVKSGGPVVEGAGEHDADGTG